VPLSAVGGSSLGVRVLKEGTMVENQGVEVRRPLNHFAVVEVASLSRL
jgi:hypothetical protein